MSAIDQFFASQKAPQSSPPTTSAPVPAPKPSLSVKKGSAIDSFFANANAPAPAVVPPAKQAPAPTPAPAPPAPSAQVYGPKMPTVSLPIVKKMSSLDFTKPPEPTLGSSSSTLAVPTPEQQAKTEKVISKVVEPIRQYKNKPGAGPAAVRTVTDAIKQLDVASKEAAGSNIGPDNRTTLEKTTVNLKAGAAAFNLLMTPFVAPFQAAENIQLTPKDQAPSPFEIPKAAVKYSATAMNRTFGVAVEALPKLVDYTFSKLPQTPEVQKYKDISETVSSLVGMYLVGELAHKAGEIPGAVKDIRTRTVGVNEVVGSAAKILDVPVEKNVIGQIKKFDPETVKQNYRQLAHETHPDRGGSPQEFRTINQAKTILEDFNTMPRKEFFAKYKTPVEAVQQVVRQIPETTAQNVQPKTEPVSNVERVLAEEAAKKQGVAVAPAETIPAATSDASLTPAAASIPSQVKPIKLENTPLHNRIMDELVNAEAGKRIAIRNENSSGMTFSAQRSTFPEWIPEELRRKPLLEAVSRHIMEGTVPTKAAEARLYKVVADEMNAQNAVLNDSAFIEQQRKNLYNPFATPEENAAALAKFDQEYAKLKGSSVAVGDGFKYDTFDSFANDQIKRFHQTSPEIAALIEQGGFRTDIAGSGSTDILPEGINTKKTDAVLSLQNTGAQMEVYLPKNARIKDFASRDELEHYLLYHDNGGKYSEYVKETHRLDVEGSKMVDAMDKDYEKTMDPQERTAILDRQTAILDEYDARIKEVSKLARKEAAKILRDEGFDAVNIEKDFGSFGRVTDNTIVINKDILRTKNQLSGQYAKLKSQSGSVEASASPVQPVGEPVQAGGEKAGAIAGTEAKPAETKAVTQKTADVPYQAPTDIGELVKNVNENTSGRFDRNPKEIAQIPSDIAKILDVQDQRIHISEFMIAKIMGKIRNLQGHADISPELLRELPKRLADPIEILRDDRTSDKKYLFVNLDPMTEAVVELERGPEGLTEINTFHRIDKQELGRMERKFEIVYKKGPLGETPVSSHTSVASVEQQPGGEFSGPQANPTEPSTPEKSTIVNENPKSEAPKEPPVKKELASRVYERLQAENPSLTEDVTYQPHNLKENADKAVELIATNKEKAYRIAMGVEEPPTGQTATSVNIALAEKALEEGNNELYGQLVKNRSLEQTRRGQELVAEKASVSDNGTSRYVRTLIKMRLDKVGNSYLGNLTDKLLKKTHGKRAIDVIDREVSKAKERIKRTKEFDLEEAQRFLDSLACK